MQMKSSQYESRAPTAGGDTQSENRGLRGAAGEPGAESETSATRAEELQHVFTRHQRGESGGGESEAGREEPREGINEWAIGGDEKEHFTARGDESGRASSWWWRRDSWRGLNKRNEEDASQRLCPAAGRTSGSCCFVPGGCLTSCYFLNWIQPFFRFISPHSLFKRTFLLNPNTPQLLLV